MKRLKKILPSLIGWAISIGLLAHLLAEINLRNLWLHLKDARWSLILAATALNLIVMLIKSLRWKWIMQPFHDTSFWRSLKINFIGHAGNNVLPARGGDILRIHLLSSWEGVSRVSLVSVTWVEKIIDALAMILLFTTMAFFLPYPSWMLKGTIVVGLFCLVSIALIATFHHRRFHQERGDKKWKRFRTFFHRLNQGFMLLKHPAFLTKTLLVSLLFDGLIVATLYLCQLALGATLSVTASLVVFLGISLSIIIPSAPSQIGTFEYAAVLCFASFGLSAAAGFDIAIVYHAVQVVPITLLGALAYALSQTNWEEKAGEKSEA